MTRSTPAARAAATSSIAVIPQSTVRISAVPRSASRSMRAGREPVAVVDPAGQKPADVGAQGAQGAHHDRGGAHAVDVVVAVDGDPPAGRRCERGSASRTRSIPANAAGSWASRGLQEGPGLSGRDQAAADQDLGEGVPDPQLALQRQRVGELVRRELETLDRGRAPAGLAAAMRPAAGPPRTRRPQSLRARSLRARSLPARARVRSARQGRPRTSSASVGATSDGSACVHAARSSRRRRARMAVIRAASISGCCSRRRSVIR